MYDEICEAIKLDLSIREMIIPSLTSSCYPDPELKTATIDVGFYLARFYLEEKRSEHEADEWFSKDYSPNLSVDDWVSFFQDSSVFTTGSLQIMKRMKDYGGQATCTQLSVKYGESKNFYNSGSTSLARRIVDKTGCEVLKENNDNARWWPVLYIGRYADKNETGSYVWKLRDELSKALEQVGLGDIELYASTEVVAGSCGYWWLTANPKIWSFTDIKIGEEQNYTLYNENGNKRRVFQNFLDAKVGDIVIGYEANPVKKVVALGRITQGNDGKAIYFEKTGGLASPIDYQTLKECSELAKMEFFVQPNGSLFKLTKGEYDFIMDIIPEENPLKQPDSVIQKYTKEDFLSKVYMTEERYDVLEALLRNKMNVILQGAPSVGKTFTAKKLAYAMMGEVDDSRIEMV